MLLKQVPLKDIKTYTQNPRDHDPLIEPLVEAISRFGFRVPVLMKQDGTLIDGHGRLKAAKRLGMSSIPAFVCQDGEELTPELEKAFRISVNELATKADWDQDKLIQELESLNLEFDVDELSKLTGFDNDLVSDLLGDDDFEEEESSAVGKITRLTNEITFPTTGHLEFPKLLEKWYEGPTPEAWLGDDDGQYHLYTFSSDSAANLPWDRTVIGFYTADGKLERVWRDTAGVTEKFLDKKPAGLISPDFSVFNDAPLAMRLMPAYQSLWCGRYFQEAGFPIIVNVASCVKDIEHFLAALPSHAPLSRQIQASMTIQEVENEKTIIREIAKFEPCRFWVYSPKKILKRFEKELCKVKNTSSITPRFWARSEKYGF